MSFNKKTAEEIWKSCLEVLKENIDIKAYQEIFEPIKPIKYENNILVIQLPSIFYYELIEEKYAHLIIKFFRKKLGETFKLEYLIEVNKNENSNKRDVLKLPAQDKPDLSTQEIKYPIEFSGKNIFNPFLIPGIKKINIDPQLIPSYCFENFVEGECNRFAKATALAYANSVDKSSLNNPLNPLFIYSGNGLGKTHLCQAIGLEVKKKFPDKIVLYVPSSRFLNQYTESLKNQNFNDFIQFYQLIDLLIIDDVHDLANKTQTQEILFQIFNHLRQNGKYLVFTADRSPAELVGFEQRLISRFRWGVVVDIQPPDYNTRLEILKRKAYNSGVEINHEILEFIAMKVTTNIRELEGALNSILAYSTFTNKNITIDFAKEVIRKIIKPPKVEVSLDYIQKCVCDVLNISPEEIKQKTKKHDIVIARQLIMYFAKEYGNKQLSVIGSFLGGKTHSTVIYGYKTIRNLIQVDRKFKQIVEEIDKRIKLLNS